MVSKGLTEELQVSHFIIIIIILYGFSYKDVFSWVLPIYRIRWDMLFCILVLV